MEVILLERVGKLGQMGDVVRVKDGFARNFLLPRGKALRATKENRTRFEGMKAELETRNAALKDEAGQVAGKIEGKSLVILRQASESGQLYGSVTTRDIATMLSTADAVVNRSQVVLNAPIKAIGQYKLPIALHSEVGVIVTLTVARSAEEAERIARGEDVTVRRTEAEEAKAAVAEEAAAAFFEPEVVEARRAKEEKAEPAAEAAAEPAAAKAPKEKKKKEAAPE